MKGGKSISFESLVEICGLIPDTKNWKIWSDEAGNTVRLSDKGLRVYVAKNPQQTTTSDVFFKAHPSKIARHSYWAMLIQKDDPTLCFLGNDGRLRVCHFRDGRWLHNSLPLTIGLDQLRTVVNGYMNNDVRKASAKNVLVGGYPDSAWEDRIECLIRNDTKQL